MSTSHLKSTAVAVALVAMLGAGSAQADSFFYAINQFSTVEKLNGDTGAVVDSFVLPSGAGNSLSIAVVGNIGYYTQFDNNVYKVDMTTHAFLGVAFGVTGANQQNGITTDSSGTLWLADLTNLRNFSTSGTLLSDYSFPSSASGYRDGSVVFNGMTITNRGDQQGPYDLFSLPSGTSGALTLVTPAFINPAINGQTNFGSNGIAFNGVNFYTSDEQAHRVSKWDINGVFVSYAALDPSSRYENWTFASQDIVPTGGVPEPATWAMMLLGFGGLGAMLRRRRGQVALAA